MADTTTCAHAAIDLYEMATGAVLDDRDASSVEFMLKVAEDGRWVSHTLMLGGARPVVLHVRALAGLFLLDERVSWSGPNYPATVDAFKRLRELIDGSETLRSRVRRISAANGDQRIEAGGSLRFLARSSRYAGRGLVSDCHIAAGPLSGEDVRAHLAPMLAGSANPQLVLDAP